MRAILLLLPLALLPAPPAGAGKAAAPSPLDRAREAVKGGVRFLLETQNPDGSWGYHAQRSPYRIYCPVPGGHRSFRAATTALVLLALLEVPDRDPRLRAARRKGIDWLVAHARVKRSNGRELYNCWAHGYGLQAIARYLQHPPEGFDVERARAAAAELVRALGLYQMLDGGWGYFDFTYRTRHPAGPSMSFTTAAVVLALKEARAAGIAVPEPMVRRALRCLLRSRTVDGNFVYSFNHRTFPQGGINRPQGALTRNPVCHYALYRFGAGSSKADVVKAVRNLVAKRQFARMALHRPVPHESWFNVSGYFYLFGYAHAVESCRTVDPGLLRELRDPIIGEVLATRAPDGSFWDYPLYGYHKPYGTAYALLALLPLVADEGPPESPGNGPAEGK